VLSRPFDIRILKCCDMEMPMFSKVAENRWIWKKCWPVGREANQHYLVAWFRMNGCSFPREMVSFLVGMTKDGDFV